MRLSAPEPRAFVIEKSIDGGQSFSPFQYYAEDCMVYFGLENDGPITEPDGVQCVTVRYGGIEASTCVRQAPGTVVTVCAALRLSHPAPLQTAQ